LESLEKSIAKLHETMADPTFFQQGKDQILAQQQELERIQQTLDESFRRWEELESIATSPT